MVNAVAEGAEFVTLRPSARRAVRSFRHPFRTSAGEGDRLPAADGIRDRVLSSSALAFYTASEILLAAVLATIGVVALGRSLSATNERAGRGPHYRARLPRHHRPAGPLSTVCAREGVAAIAGCWCRRAVVGQL